MRSPFFGDRHLDEVARKDILKCERLIDVGPGIRPFDRFEAKTHLCIEPHWEYIEVLTQKNYPIIADIAYNALPSLRNFETILFLDVIEHMDKTEGIKCLEYAKATAMFQIVVFTPLGFVKQERIKDEPDDWGYQGWEWQTHLSGWMPGEFEGWEITVDKNYHGDHGAFLAIWNV